MTKLEIGKVYSGFEVQKITYVPEVEANIYELSHLQSGARLLYMDRDDDNKVFAVGFKTIPEDSTGVFHILEHSVLCGSKRYPVKEPFVELLKSSMQTFLNAFTFPDKTVYPCASCNDKDFANLMSVYLDAVLAPAIYTQEEIFMQEGWHYEVEGKEKPLTYRGVVFNEMKGAFSSVDTQMFSCIDQALYPDTPYRFSSGGDPRCIPNLTYEQFLAAHKKYYHPENSYLYLYGNLDIEERLAFLDREYLSSYTRLNAIEEIAVQSPVVNMDVVGTYAIAASDEEEKNSYISFSCVVGTYADREKILALDILMSALTSTNESPLKKAFLDSGMASDMFAFVYSGIAQPYLIFEIRKTDADKKDAFLKLLFEELEKYAREGVDRKALLAEINQAEFHLREGKQGGMPAGLSYGLDILDSWLYGGAPQTYLEYESALSHIRKGVEEGYFEDLIRSCILNSCHKAAVVLNPSKTLGEEQAKAEADRLESFRSSLTEEQMENLLEKNKKLIQHQTKEDTPEQIATLPVLSLSDVSKQITPLPMEEKKIGDTVCLQSRVATHKIAYLNYYFDLRSLSEEQLPYAALFAELLGQVSLQNCSASDLDAKLKTVLGSFSTFTQLFTSCENPEEVLPVLTVRTSILEANIPEALELVREILTSTIFNRDEIQKIVIQSKFMRKESISANGNSYAMTRVRSYVSREGRYSELLGGISYYYFLSDLCKKIETDFDSICHNLQAVAAVLTENHLTLGLTGEDGAWEAVQQAYNPFPTVEERPLAVPPKPVYNGNEAFIVPSEVNYVAKGINFRRIGVSYSGKLRVLSQILSLDYLWNEIRVRGGAYGTGFSASSIGCAVYSSYRDPHVAETVQNYDKAVDYLRSFVKQNPDITKYIISVVAASDRPLCPRDKGAAAQSAYFRKETDQIRSDIRNQVLATTVSDLESYIGLLQEIADQKIACVVGNKARIEEAGDLFPIREEL